MNARLRLIMSAGLAVCVAATAPTPLRADANLGQKLIDARQSFRDLLDSPDRGVPEALVEKCRCVAVIPHLVKGAFGWGARFGQGVLSCRDSSGVWSAPAFLRLTGGSVGFQIGAQSSDVVLFFMNERGARSLLDSKFTLGGTASVAAGPAGRSGEVGTDLTLEAEIYSYARSRGLFAGIALEGARLAPDEKANAAYYGASATARTLLFGAGAPQLPAEAERFRKALP